MLLWESARLEAEKLRAVLSPGSHGLDNLVKMASMLGARVWVQPLEPDISGFVLKEKDTPPEVFINALETPQRQRFTLAHEIGHLIERASIAGDDDYSFIDYRKSDDYNLHEFYADEFAGALLMPAEEFEQVMRQQGEYGAAEYFGVSVPAVRKHRARLEKNPGVMTVHSCST